MNRNFFYKISLVICLGFYTLTTSAQQVNTLYFMDNVPIRSYFNPAFQAYSDFYFGLPLLGYSQLGIENNSLTLKDLVYKDANGKSIFFLNPNGDKNKFYNTLMPTTLLQGDVHINLLDFGFRTGRSYWTFGLTERIDAQFGVPKDFMKLLLYGMPQIDNNVYNLQGFGGDFSAYTEAALGYSRRINERITVGAKLKFLYGTFNVSSINSSLNMTTGFDQWTFKGNNVMNYSSPMALTGSSLNALGLAMPTTITDYIKPSGLGGGIDLGVTYKPIKELTLSAALVDLGMINWTANAVNLTNSLDYTFTGVQNLNILNPIDFKHIADSVINVLGTSVTSTQTAKPYTTYTSPKLNIGVEYAFLQDRLSVGVLSRTLKRDQNYFEEVTASVNGRPVDWFNMSLSYSVMNGRTSNIGAGIGLRTGILNWFLAADYIPMSYATYPLNAGGVSFNMPVAYNSKGMNFAFGVNLVFGNRKDEDKDGVIDRKDVCAETPFSVVVDRKGCPLDTDGDGVPDYLDKCAKTPPEAYNRINQDGCPVDNDEDGVPDYMDKCPDSPKGAAGFVDANGCLADADKDGVPDFKDKCPGTPAGMRVDSIGCPFDTDGDGVTDNLDKCPGTPVAARGMVDSIGCPLDKDGDGVADYLDKCPNTPAEARGKVDKVGCPLDTDMDGVPDYLDKCPNTPAEERATVDKNGCSNMIDSDGDGVSDKMDKCPNTPAEAHGMVDTNGCPLDSDGDGVPDYLDNCPKVAGAANNKGCPDTNNQKAKQDEVKKELKNLFQKALRGIQFETAKYTFIPVSYVIMNQIAGVLIANPTYTIEIRGHTDNEGKADANMILSNNRANAVMKYLINKGIDPKRMTAKGFGQTLPVATNNTAAGRAINRRVEFVVTYEEITFE